MQTNKIAFLFLLFITASSCSNNSAPSKDTENNKTVQNTWTPPAAGTTVAKLEEKIATDKLNNTYFRVEIISTETSKEGHYNVKLEYGFNKNETTIDLPALPANAILKPVLQKGTEAFHCILGFDTGDGKFNELYQISVTDGDIKMKQTKGYYAS